MYLKIYITCCNTTVSKANPTHNHGGLSAANILCLNNHDIFKNKSQYAKIHHNDMSEKRLNRQEYFEHCTKDNVKSAKRSILLHICNNSPS